MPGDATILEGPATPAPLFAYRAIRSIFFASPDSSPEHYGKENIVPTYTTLPLKSTTQHPLSQQLTPSQKRKREVVQNGGASLSPTKGILRTPGLATPRAKALRDINVKFKSVSPELRNLDNALQARDPSTPNPQSAPQRAVQPSNLASKVQPTTHLSTTEPHIPHEQNAQSLPAPSACPVSPAALASYIGQTEKEMKRLIRYGKKMREYALKKDVENQELKHMIESLRKENARLRPKEAVIEETNRTLHASEKGIGTEERALSHRANVISKAVSPALRNKHHGHVREEVDRVETTVRSQIRKSSTNSLQRPLPTDGSSENVPMLLTRDVEQVSTMSVSAEPQRKTSDSVAITSLTLQTTKPALPAPLVKTLATESTIPINTGTLRLAPDRAAAARERLRKRVEARKGSASLDIEVAADKVAKDARDRTIAEKTTTTRNVVEEPSDLWANL